MGVSFIGRIVTLKVSDTDNAGLVPTSVAVTVTTVWVYIGNLYVRTPPTSAESPLSLFVAPIDTIVPSPDNDTE